MNTSMTSTATKRSRALALLAATLGAAIIFANCASADGDQVADARPPGTDGVAASSTLPVVPNDSGIAPDDGISSDAAEDAADLHDNSTGYPDGGSHGSGDDGGAGEGGELDPFGDGGGAPSGPCDDVLATGATLLVTPGPAVLPAGTMSSALTITNCAAAAVDWTAATVPTVNLATGGGNLTPGSSTELGFTIDSAAHEPGAVTFKIKVSESGHNHYVDVHAFRELVGSDLVGDLGLSAGEGAGGCANQCITSGKITGNFSTSNVTLEVGLNTAAMIRVWVSQQPPVEVDGHPEFPGVAPQSQTVIAQTAWSTTLEPLQPATKYYFVVAATDEFEHISYRSGSFLTATPVELPSDHASPDGPAGCSVQCITRAEVTPQATSTDINLRVETNTSALLDVWVSTDAPDLSGDEPTFGEGVDKAATTDGLDVTAWDAVIGNLTADTDYHIIVRASDLQGGRSFRVGTFHTADGPKILIRFHSIEVERDGDPGGANRGEISFRWGFDDIAVGSRGEAKIDSGTAFLLPDNPASTSFVAHDDGGFLPKLYVSASERDADALSQEFCSMGDGVPHVAGHDDGCDARWNVASSPAILPGDFDGMARCSQFALEDVADLPCLALVSPDHGDDYPLFWAVVSFEFLTD